MEVVAFPQPSSGKAFGSDKHERDLRKSFGECLQAFEVEPTLHGSYVDRSRPRNGSKVRRLSDVGRETCQIHAVWHVPSAPRPHRPNVPFERLGGIDDKIGALSEALLHPSQFRSVVRKTRGPIGHTE